MFDAMDDMEDSPFMDDGFMDEDMLHAFEEEEGRKRCHTLNALSYAVIHRMRYHTVYAPLHAVHAAITAPLL